MVQNIRLYIFTILIEGCLLFLVIFTPFAYGAVESWAVATFEIVAAVMFLLWITASLLDGTFRFIHGPPIILMLCFIAYGALQFFLPAQHSPLTSLYRYATRTELLKLLAYLSIFVVTLNTFRNKEQMLRMLAVIITVGFITSILYLIQRFGLPAPRMLINRDHFAAYLGMIIPLALGLLFAEHNTSRDIRRMIYGVQPLLFFCVIIMGAGLLFTLSRGGMLSFMVSLLCMVLLAHMKKTVQKKSWIIVAALVCIALTIMWMGATPVVEKLVSLKAELLTLYFNGRIIIWRGVVGIIQDYPWFGTGLGTFNFIYPMYQPAALGKLHYTYAHSDVLELLSEAGVIGFTLALLATLSLFLWLLRRFLERRHPWVLGSAIGFFGALVGIGVHSFADFSIKTPAVAILLVIIMALFFVLLNYKRDTKAITVTVRSVRWPLFILCLAFTVWYALICVQPALADHYMRKAQSARLPKAHGGQAERMADGKDSNVSYALSAMRSAIKLDPLNAAHYYKLGQLYAGERTPHDAHEAIVHYKKALSLNPTNAKYHQSLAWLYGQIADSYMRARQYSVKDIASEMQYRGLAHTAFETAISFEPNNAYRYRAYALWLLSNPTEENVREAYELYQRVVALMPKLSAEFESTFEKYKESMELT